MHKITPHLWFDTQAKEAAAFYTRLFSNSRIVSTTTIHDTPSGSNDIVNIELMGQPFQMISAGPLFRFTPAVSFRVDCATKDAVKTLHDGLIDGGMALVPLGEYPFSPQFAWVQDRFGLSWQLVYTADGAPQEAITPVLMFVGAVCGKAEEAVRFYTSVFKDAHMGDILRYGSDEAPDVEGTVKQAAFTLAGQSFAAMDSAQPHEFTFNEAISFIVSCHDQGEIDYYWNQLSAVPESEQCGWLKDKYGVSWQIVPAAMDEMMKTDDPAQLTRVVQAFLPMKKFDLAALQRAWEGT
ncbi:MAG: VOC family protein [Chloroflexota bacterium]|nr:VOC family protein [Chloroflexota bacterium]